MTRIALLSAFDASNPRALSGTPHQMAKALARHCGEVDLVGPSLDSPWVLAGRVLNQVSRRASGRIFDWLHTLRVARDFGVRLSARLKKLNCDVLFAPHASSELAFLETDLPVVYTSDATFALTRGYQPMWSNPWSRSGPSGHVIERRAIARADALVYPSEWVARSAVEDYGADPSRITVLPYGANLEEAPPAAVAAERRSGERCRLLFVGVDWRRKGGAVAVDTVRALRRQIPAAELVVCGPSAAPANLPVGVRWVPPVDKSDIGERRRLDSLYREADFFVLPTRADCSPIVLCEAAAYGLPALSSDTGGVSGVIQDGVSGVLLPPDASGEAYTEKILELSGDDARYQAMASSARALYEVRLNWDAWGRGMRVVLDRLLA